MVIFHGYVNVYQSVNHHAIHGKSHYFYGHFQVRYFDITRGFVGWKSGIRMGFKYEVPKKASLRNREKVETTPSGPAPELGWSTSGCDG